MEPLTRVVTWTQAQKFDTALEALSRAIYEGHVYAARTAVITIMRLTKIADGDCPAIAPLNGDADYSGTIFG